jgi:hypothetical protein
MPKIAVGVGTSLHLQCCGSVAADAAVNGSEPLCDCRGDLTATPLTVHFVCFELMFHRLRAPLSLLRMP